MSENTIFVSRYRGDEDGFEVDRREAWRYAGYMGVGQKDENLERLFDKVIEETRQAFDYKVCYRRMDIEWKGDELILPFTCVSRDLEKLLSGCSQVIIFAATIGLGIDRYIKRNERLSVTKALLAQGLGAERVESLCDKFCNDFKTDMEVEGKTITRRFSPGYGDVPLDTQVEFFKLLDCNRQVGISLNESLLMTPSKSVTAIFGVKDKCLSVDKNLETNKCAYCLKYDCDYRGK